MFNVRIAQSAALGKWPELHTLTLAQVKQRQAQGTRIALSTPIIGASGRLSIGLSFETLQDLHEFRQRNVADPKFQEFVARISPLLAAPAETEIWEVILPAQQGDAPAYVQAITWTAQDGEGPALRAALLERMKRRQGEGLRCALAEQVAGGAYRLGLNILLGSLGELEANRNKNRNDASFQEFGRRMAEITTSTEVTIAEVLVPFQPVGRRELAGAASR
ncbi:MAG: hypothetical protein AB7N24_21285 [Dehalococcoidia bacterium]